MIVAGGWLLPALALGQALPVDTPARAVGRVPPTTVTPGPEPPPVPTPLPAPRPQRPDTGGLTDQFRAGPYTYAPRFDRGSARDRDYRRNWSPAFGGFWSTYTDVPGTFPVLRPGGTEPADGRLVLDVAPLSAQVFVDGYYVGAVNDVQARGLWLEAGPRRIELRADGYDTVTFDVRIVEGGSVTYARSLSPAAAVASAARPPAAPAKPFYVIRGCYAGTTPPDAVRLPAGCRAADARVVPPVVAPASAP